MREMRRFSFSQIRRPAHESHYRMPDRVTPADGSRPASRRCLNARTTRRRASAAARSLSRHDRGRDCTLGDQPVRAEGPNSIRDHVGRVRYACERINSPSTVTRNSQPIGWDHNVQCAHRRGSFRTSQTSARSRGVLCQPRVSPSMCFCSLLTGRMCATIARPPATP
jgi:hypothetical protein